jgi:DNA-binding beta-propeller fold protein YncE
MNRLSLSIFALILLVLAGCATAPPPVKQVPVFFPEPPNPPRVQFLTSFRGARDIEPPKSGFWRFITGGKERAIVLDKPYGIAGQKGKIYICDTNSTVMVINLENRTFAPLEGARGAGKLVQPLNISIDKDGNKYVADVLRGQVVMFDKNDAYVKAFGPLEGWKPVDAAAFEGLLYVVDSKSADIKVFDVQSGLFRNSLAKKDDPASKLGLPTNLVLDSKGYLYVSDSGRFQIIKLDRDGNSRGTIGSLGKVPGSFARPRGLALDRQNRLYAVDAAFNNLQLFNADTAQLLLFFGKGGIEPGDLNLAAKVAIDYDDIKYFQQYADPNFQIEYLILVTSQFGARSVSVYGFGTEKGQVYKTDEELAKEVQELVEKEQKKQQENPEKTKSENTGNEKPGDAVQKKD